MASEIQCNIMLQGFHMSLETITTFIIEKKEILGVEIFASQLAMDMLANGTPPEIVYVNICKIIA